MNLRAEKNPKTVRKSTKAVSGYEQSMVGRICGRGRPKFVYLSNERAKKVAYR